MAANYDERGDESRFAAHVGSMRIIGDCKQCVNAQTRVLPAWLCSLQPSTLSTDVRDRAGMETCADSGVRAAAGVSVGDGVAVGVAVSVGMTVVVGVGLSVGQGVAVSVGWEVGVGVEVGKGVPVGVAAGTGVEVGSGVGAGVGGALCTTTWTLASAL